MINPVYVEDDLRREYMRIINRGYEDTDRTGTGVYCMPHAYFEWDGIPVIRLKKMFPRNAELEAIWMLKGLTDVTWLKDRGVNYWDKWALPNGSLGESYGWQIRNFGGKQPPFGVENTPGQYGFDQLAHAIRELKQNPDSRRTVIILWNPHSGNHCQLMPCHTQYQFKVYSGRVHMFVSQRSADMFLGVPYDFILFSIILHIVAKVTQYGVGRVHYTCNDIHLYKNHMEPMKEYMSRSMYDLSQDDYLKSSSFIYTDGFADALDDIHKGFSPEKNLDIVLEAAEKFGVINYDSYVSLPFIKAEVAV